MCLKKSSTFLSSAKNEIQKIIQDNFKNGEVVSDYAARSGLGGNVGSKNTYEKKNTYESQKERENNLIELSLYFLRKQKWMKKLDGDKRKSVSSFPLENSVKKDVAIQQIDDSKTNSLEVEARQKNVDQNVRTGTKLMVDVGVQFCYEEETRIETHTGDLLENNESHGDVQCSLDVGSGGEVVEKT